MRNRRLIRFAPGAAVHMALPVPMREGMIKPIGSSPIGKTLNWLQGTLFGCHAEGERP